jgi:SAM-dependent methyltransferase
MIGETILRVLSKKPGTGDYGPGDEDPISGDELALLRRAFPHFSALVHGKRVVDFGCGFGRQSVALASEEGCRVCGIDANTVRVAKCRRFASESGMENGRVVFAERPTPEMRGAFDVVISQNAMEHFADPAAVLDEMKGLIHKEGKILIAFGPPWFSARGTHMHFFCKVPWLNILFSERTVMNVRALYRSDGATRYEEVESGLNRMTLGRFERLIGQSGLRVEYWKCRCHARQTWMARIPWLRELVVKHVSCVLAIRA